MRASAVPVIRPLQAGSSTDGAAPPRHPKLTGRVPHDAPRSASPSPPSLLLAQFRGRVLQTRFSYPLASPEALQTGFAILKHVTYSP